MQSGNEKITTQRQRGTSQDFLTSQLRWQIAKEIQTMIRDVNDLPKKTKPAVNQQLVQ